MENGLNATNFAMLGLGDIVIPGIFIALLLRYDHSLNRKSHFYFYATYLGNTIFYLNAGVIVDRRLHENDFCINYSFSFLEQFFKISNENFNFNLDCYSFEVNEIAKFVVCRHK